jgi:hypothetical protein
VARIAALGCGAEKICVPLGIDEIFPLRADVHGSCKNTNRGVQLHSAKHFDKLAMAICEFAKLICLNEIYSILVLNLFV